MIYEEILLYHFPEFKKTYDEKVSKNESVISHIREG
jgi:mitogen-activated protein kinase 1/3